MKVKVLCLGRSAKEVEVNAGATVEQCIQAANMPTDGIYTRHLNGAPAFDSDVVAEGNVITLVPSVKGGC